MQQNTSPRIIRLQAYKVLCRLMELQRKTIPVGTVTDYLPVTITPAADFTVAVFNGITANGMITGTALPPFRNNGWLMLCGMLTG